MCADPTVCSRPFWRNSLYETVRAKWDSQNQYFNHLVRMFNPISSKKEQQFGYAHGSKIHRVETDWYLLFSIIFYNFMPKGTLSAFQSRCIFNAHFPSKSSIIVLIVGVTLICIVDSTKSVATMPISMHE